MSSACVPNNALQGRAREPLPWDELFLFKGYLFLHPVMEETGRKKKGRKEGVREEREIYTMIFLPSLDLNPLTVLEGRKSIGI